MELNIRYCPRCGNVENNPPDPFCCEYRMEKVYIRADLDQVVADEREACARLCEQIESIYSAPWDATGDICAEAIRNRCKELVDE